MVREMTAVVAAAAQSRGIGYEGHLVSIRPVPSELSH